MTLKERICLQKFTIGKKIFLTLILLILSSFSITSIDFLTNTVQNTYLENQGENSSTISQEVNFNIDSKRGQPLKFDLSSKFTYGLPTDEDIEILKHQYGVYEEGKNYNIQIDGHGTGVIPYTEDQWNEFAQTPMIVDVAPSLEVKSADDYPEAIDFSEEEYFPVTGDQGPQGSCCSWAAVYYAYGYQEARDQGWNAQSGNQSYLMSPAWAYNKLVSNTNEGTMIENNIGILKNEGCPTLNEMPYDPYDCNNLGSEEAWREAPLHRAEQTYLAYSFKPTNPVEVLRTFIANHVPVAFYMDGACYPNNMWDGEFIVSTDDVDSGGGAHCQTIIGYNDSMEEDSEIGAFKIVNSWGSDFGNNGYYWITYDALFDMRIIAYVVIDKPDYSPNLIAKWEFSEAPVNWLSFNVGIVNYLGSNAEKSVTLRAHNNFLLPSYMILDITDLLPFYEFYSTDFYLKITGDKSAEGILSSFKIEYWDGTNYISHENPTYTSEESPMMPFEIGGESSYLITNYLPGKSAPPYNVYSIRTENSINISWSPPMSDGHNDIFEYRIYRKELNENYFYSISTNSNLLFYEDTNITLDGIYYYNVTAVNIEGESIPSKTLIVSTVQIASSPQNFHGKYNNKSVFLSWDIPADNGTASILQYIIYRGIISTNLTQLTEPLDHLNFTDTNVSIGKTYYYHILTLNEGGPSPFSDMIKIRTGISTLVYWIGGSSGFLLVGTAIILSLRKFKKGKI